MAYRHCGAGDPVVFLHGNPTSSYLWRAVLGRVEHLGRCLAPALVGMGLSENLPSSGVASYRFVEHRHFLEALLEQLGVFERVVLVGHDWGGCWRLIGPGVTQPRSAASPTWKPSPARCPGTDPTPPLRTCSGRSEARPVNSLCWSTTCSSSRSCRPGSCAGSTTRRWRTIALRTVSRGSRAAPTLTWPRQIPIDGDPSDVHDIVAGQPRLDGQHPCPEALHQRRPRRAADRRVAPDRPHLAPPTRDYGARGCTSCPKTHQTRSAPP
jgi:haloalkane dehalogenase